MQLSSIRNELMRLEKEHPMANGETREAARALLKPHTKKANARKGTDIDAAVDVPETEATSILQRIRKIYGETDL